MRGYQTAATVRGLEQHPDLEADRYVDRTASIASVRFPAVGFQACGGPGRR